MIIGIDASRAVLGERTGTEAYSLFLTQSLALLAIAKGHLVRLYYRGQPNEPVLANTQGVEHIGLSFPRLWTHIRLASELHRRPPDVFFTPAHVIPYSYHRPSVATVHDLGFLHYPEAHTSRQLLYLRWSTGHSAKRAKRIIADSGATKRDLIHSYEIPSQKIEVIYPGIDPVLEPISDSAEIAAVIKRYGIATPYMLHIGTIQPRKNLIRLIDAFINSGVEGQLVLAGKKGWLAEPIEAHIQGLDNNDRERVNAIGYVATEDKNALLSGSGALLFPSLYEGFGFPVVEANACGTPVLASNTSSLPEIAGDAALLVDPLDVLTISDGITQIASDETMRKNLVEAGYSNVKRFSWDTAAEKTLELLTTAASK